MKTTIDIDPRLLKEARKALGTTTLKGTVDASLKAVIRRHRLQALADALGTIPLDLRPGQVRRQRAKRVADASR